jgi:hypothetical protein
MSKWLVIPGVDYGRDLDARVPGAPDFQYGEFVQSEKAVSLNIANIPNEEEWKRVEYVAVNICQPIRDKFGRIKVNSCFRCKQLNDAVQSSDASYHRLGAAVDIEPYDSNIKLMSIFEWVCNNLKFNEIIAEYFPNGWNHIGVMEGRDDSKIKLKDDKHKYAVVSLDYIKNIYA